jgi:TatD DNase family protein
MSDYLIDSHCHIQSIGLSDNTGQLWAKNDQLNLSSVLQQSREYNVQKMVVVGCNLQDSQKAVELASNYSELFPAVGIHPHEAANLSNLDQQRLEELINDQVVAIGECGLDYFYHHSDVESQKKILIWQLQLAKKYKLPLIFHVRLAFNDFWPIVQDFWPLKAVLHSFTDSMENMIKAVELGWMIGVNGIATFTKDQNQLEMFKTIPIQNLIVETDSPYLTPTPFRGTINMPKNVFYVTKFLSELRGESMTYLQQQTTLNSLKLFELERFKK